MIKRGNYDHDRLDMDDVSRLPWIPGQAGNDTVRMFLSFSCSKSSSRCSRYGRKDSTRQHRHFEHLKSSLALSIGLSFNPLSAALLYFGCLESGYGEDAMFFSARQ